MNVLVSNKGTCEWTEEQETFLNKTRDRQKQDQDQDHAPEHSRHLCSRGIPSFLRTHALAISLHAIIATLYLTIWVFSTQPDGGGLGEQPTPF